MVGLARRVLLIAVLLSAIVGGCSGFVPVNFDRPRVSLEMAMAMCSDVYDTVGPIHVDHDGHRRVAVEERNPSRFQLCLTEVSGVYIDRSSDDLYIVECDQDEDVVSIADGQRNATWCSG
jgi:hypothetical protein